MEIQEPLQPIGSNKFNSRISKAFAKFKSVSCAAAEKFLNQDDTKRTDKKK
jgi:hypothetical protein